VDPENSERGSQRIVAEYNRAHKLNEKSIFQDMLLFFQKLEKIKGKRGTKAPTLPKICP